MGLLESMRERRKVARDHDMYEGAYSRMEQARQAREEIGDPNQNLPPGLQHGRRSWRISRRATLILVVVVVVVALFSYGGIRQRTPPLAKSCTTPAIKLSHTSAKKGSNITWSATGPSGRYVLTVDAPTVSVSGGQVRVAKTAPGSGKSATLTGQPFAMSDCTATGRFAFALPVGEHTLRMIRLDGGPTTVQTQRITVTETAF